MNYSACVQRDEDEGGEGEIETKAMTETEAETETRTETETEMNTCFNRDTCMRAPKQVQHCHLSNTKTDVYRGTAR